MKNIYFILFIQLFAWRNLSAQELDPNQFFPCSIGDHWEYTQAGPDIKYTVVRDSIDQKDGSRYVFFFNPSLYYGADYRFDKNYNVFLMPQFDNWYIYKLDAKLGDSWVTFKETWAEKVLDISQGYVFGKLTTIKTIGFYRLTNGDTVLTANSKLQYWQKLAYGFGLISEENGAEQPMLLRGCRINGVVYGTVDIKNDLNNLPSEFTLYQNYPNPFNPSTNISFTIPKTTFVTVKIFDCLGKEIKVLANTYFNPGIHKLIFEAKNLPSGIYIYRIMSGNNSLAKRMVVLK
jgi:hypothetical protein